MKMNWRFFINVINPQNPQKNIKPSLKPSKIFTKEKKKIPKIPKSFQCHFMSFSQHTTISKQVPINPKNVQKIPRSNSNWDCTFSSNDEILRFSQLLYSHVCTIVLQSWWIAIFFARNPNPFGIVASRREIHR